MKNKKVVLLLFVTVLLFSACSRESVKNKPVTSLEVVNDSGYILEVSLDYLSYYSLSKGEYEDEFSISEGGKVFAVGNFLTESKACEYLGRIREDENVEFFVNEKDHFIFRDRNLICSLSILKSSGKVFGVVVFSYSELEEMRKLDEKLSFKLKSK